MKAKVGTEGYSVHPFFYSEPYDKADGGSATRWLVYTKDLSLLKKALYYFLASFPDSLAVNIHDLNADNQQWTHYVGECSKAQLLEAIQLHESYIYFDGAHQLCVIRPDTSEFFVLDEHNVLFLYFDPSDHFVWLKDAGFREMREKMIWDSVHLHHRPWNADSMRDSFIDLLGLSLYRES